ncbi:ester cyclase [Pycnococcus provasolii]
MATSMAASAPAPEADALGKAPPPASLEDVRSLRDSLYASLQSMWRASTDEESLQIAKNFVAEDAILDICAPVERLIGAQAFFQGYVAPVRAALQPRIQRRDDIFVGGVTRSNDRERDDPSTRDGVWIACTGHYMGNFEAAGLFGVPPAADGRLVLLRYGEYYRVDVNTKKVVEAKIMVDLLDLALRAGHSIPLPHLLGTEYIYPPPATHDGVKPNGDVSLGAKSADLVEAMLFDLHAFDPNTFQSKNMTGKQGYWHEDMFWYGPAGIGANFTYPGFDKHHRISFLTAFPDRKGGNHYCRIGDGDYVASSGWPSMTMTHAGDYLGVKATNKAMTCRVMDLWRCEDGQIMENWVLLDLVHLFGQMGVDLIGGIKAADAATA